LGLAFKKALNRTRYRTYAHESDKNHWYQTLVVTQKGEAGLEMMKKVDMKVVNTLTQGISDKELAQFDAVAKKIVANLSGEID
jgi:hypothetical protein